MRNKTALNARTAAPVTGAEMLEMLAAATVVRTAAPATETASPDSRIASRVRRHFRFEAK